jgi:hypothetical protein
MGKKGNFDGVSHKRCAKHNTGWIDRGSNWNDEKTKCPAAAGRGKQESGNRKVKGQLQKSSVLT